MPTTTPFPPEIIALVTPQLLTSLFALEHPWPKSTTPTAAEWSAPRDSTAAYRSLAWPVLLALSKLPLPDARKLDFFELLPSPSDPEFLPQAVGMLVLLDQAPRHICTNQHERWRNAFFDELALGFALALRKLPDAMCIHEFARWQATGWSLAHFLAASPLLTAPFAHSEDLAVHTALLLPEVQGHRRLAETQYGVVDAQHAAEDPTLAASANTLEFARLIRAWIPRGAGTPQTLFWWCRVIEAHTPVIRVFGRYPYRNRAMGRVSTPAELVFLKETGDFGVSVDEGAAARIRADVEAGVWTALGE
jgi:uncharacterized protein (DUF924 family)